MEKINCTNCGTNNPSNFKYCTSCGFKLPKVQTVTFNTNAQQQITEPKNKNKKILSIVISVIAFFLSFYGVQQLFFKHPSLDKMMMETASELNKTCPIMIDHDTRLDNAIAMPDNVFQYNYTLINIEKAEVNMDTVKKYIEPAIINNAKTSPDLKFYRDNETTLSYNYRDKNGVFVLKISVTPDMYQ